MLSQLLSVYYNLPSVEKIKIAPRTGFTDNEYIYFITPSKNKEENCEWQQKIAAYLKNLGFKHIAFPIRNRYGEWQTLFEEETYYVLKLKCDASISMKRQYLNFKHFHNYGRKFIQNDQIFPVHLNWKKEWVKELTLFEQNVFNQKKEGSNLRVRLIINLMPYVIGLCEHVIALTRELNELTHFNYSDYLTLTFYRFREANIYSLIWTDEIIMDHFTRDLAEYIRYLFLNDHDAQIVWQFLIEYQKKEAISGYGWNLLIIRLLFPSDLLDILAVFLKGKNPRLNIAKYLEQHESYQNKVMELKRLIEQKEASLTLPVLKWL